MEDNTPTPPTPEAPIVKPVKTANSPLTVILLLIILILIGTTTFLGYQNMQLSKQVSEKKITTSPSPSSTPDPTANWKTYQSKTVGYSIRVPSTWKLSTQQEDSSLLSHQDYLVNMMLSSEKATEGEGDFVNSIIIIFPIKIAGPHKDIGSQYEQGLEGLASQIKNTDSSKQTFQYISINGKRTLLKLQVNNPTPPANFAGGYFNGSTKTAYIDLGNGSILTISGSWDNQYPNFESTFDQILSTFQFTEQTQNDTSTWKVDTTHLVSNTMGETRNYSLMIKYPSDWQLIKDVGTHNQDDLIKDCVNYTLTSSNNTKLTLEPICTSYQEQIENLPSSYDTIKDLGKVGNDASEKEIIRFLTSANNYQYAQARSNPSQTSNSINAMGRQIFVTYAPDDYYFIPITAKINTSFSSDLSIADQIIKSLELTRS